MNYYVDSECFKRFWLFIWVDQNGNKGALTAPAELDKWLAERTEEDHLITKNGLGYDWIMFLHALEYDGPEEEFCPYMRGINDEIILEGKHRISAAKMIAKLKRKFPFQHTDVQELLNMYANLKRAAGSLGYHTVRDSGIDFGYDGPFSPEMIREVTGYGWEDCGATQFIFERPDTITEMKSRDIMSETFGIDVRGLGRPRAMSKIIDSLFEQKTGNSPWDIKRDLYRSPKKYHFGKILKNIGKDSRIAFESDILKEFHSLLCRKERKFNARAASGSAVKKAHFDDNGWVQPLSHQFEYLKDNKLDIIIPLNGKNYRFKEGGIHSEHDDRPVYLSDASHQLYDIDFTAFYPGLLLRFDIFPEWMKQAGFDIKALYKGIVDKNLAEKAKPNGDKMLRYVYKIISNLFYGKYGELSDSLGDPRLQLKTCLTGQLVLLRLIEKLEAQGIECVYANTDGIVVSCHRGLQDKMNRVLDGVSKVLDIGIEPVPVNAMYLDNCNSYIWEMKSGYIKRKKEYTDAQSMLNPTLKFPIVVKAVTDFIIQGVPVEKTIAECTDILQFCEVKSASSAAINVTVDFAGLKEKAVRKEIANTVAKVKSKNRGYELKEALEKKDHPLAGRINVMPKNLRYYHTTDGETFYKIAHSGASAGRLSKHGLAEKCTLMLETSPELPDNIDYDFYVAEAQKRIGDWQPIPREENIFQD